MNGPSQGSPQHTASLPVQAGFPARRADTRFFQATDWWSFGLATAGTLAVYLDTLAPSVTLEFSGELSTAAFYAGVAGPPGFPVWTVYAWLFSVLLPFSNVAWRVAVSSAVAGALACGLVALMVSRGGAMILEGLKGTRKLAPKEEGWLRVICGFIAGMALGLDGAFWQKAVVVEQWALALLLFAAVLTLLMRWRHAPEQTGFLYSACLLYGLALTTSQALGSAALGFGFVILLAKPDLGRDFFFATTLLVGGALSAQALGVLPGCWATLMNIEELKHGYIFVTILSAAITMTACLRTRRLLSGWKIVLVSGTSLLLGLSACFYLPLASMTNPPMDWGHPRDLPGFVHLVSRGQYERLQPTASWAWFAEQLGLYGRITSAELGTIYLLLALIPYVFLRRMQSRDRGWILGLAAVYVCVAFLLLALLNPANQTMDFVKVFFSFSHLILSLSAGYGLALLGSFLAGRNMPRWGRN